MMQELRRAAKLQREYLKRLEALKTCRVDGCWMRQEEDLCIDHGLEAKRAELVKKNGGHGLDTYKLHKIRHQSTRGMVARGETRERELMADCY